MTFELEDMLPGQRKEWQSYGLMLTVDAFLSRSGRVFLQWGAVGAPNGSRWPAGGCFADDPEMTIKFSAWKRQLKDAAEWFQADPSRFDLIK